MDESYSGYSSYKYVDSLINLDDPELMVVSPYISNYYTRFLVRNANKKRIRIITSGSSLGYRNSLIANYAFGSVKGYAKAMAFLMILDAISAYLKFNFTTLILSMILIISAIFAYMKYKRTNRNMQVKVAKERFVHEKLYIGKEMAIVGSANLTYNGMHRNMEHINVIKDKNEINKLKEHFEYMWNNGIG